MQNKEQSYKQVILVRDDLKLPKGKMAVQVAHAAVEAAFRVDHDTLSEWQSFGMKKVVLKVKDLQELFSYQNKAKSKSVVTAVITDAGLTTIDPGTITCCAIGPAKSELIDTITGDLKLIS